MREAHDDSASVGHGSKANFRPPPLSERLVGRACSRTLTGGR